MRISDWISDVCSSDLAEQIGFAFLAEVGFDDPRPAAADAAGISERDIMRVAAGILIDCDQARHAAAADIFAAHGMARTLGGDYDDIDVGAHRRGWWRERGGQYGVMLAVDGALQTQKHKRDT